MYPESSHFNQVTQNQHFHDQRKEQLKKLEVKRQFNDQKQILLEQYLGKWKEKHQKVLPAPVNCPQSNRNYKQKVQELQSSDDSVQMGQVEFYQTNLWRKAWRQIQNKEMNRIANKIRKKVMLLQTKFNGQFDNRMKQTNQINKKRVLKQYQVSTNPSFRQADYPSKQALTDFRKMKQWQSIWKKRQEQIRMEERVKILQLLKNSNYGLNNFEKFPYTTSNQSIKPKINVPNNIYYQQLFNENISQMNFRKQNQKVKNQYYLSTLASYAQQKNYNINNESTLNFTVNRNYPMFCSSNFQQNEPTINSNVSNNISKQVEDPGDMYQVFENRKKRGSSIAWQFFLLNPQTQMTKCQLCDAEFIRTGPQTTVMLYHLKKKHKKQLEDKLNNKSKRRKIIHHDNQERRLYNNPNDDDELSEFQELNMHQSLTLNQPSIWRNQEKQMNEFPTIKS